MKNAYEVYQALGKTGYTDVVLTESNQNHYWYTGISPDHIEVDIRFDIHDGWILDKPSGMQYWDLIKRL